MAPWPGDLPPQHTSKCINSKSINPKAVVEDDLQPGKQFLLWIECLISGMYAHPTIPVQSET